MFILLIFITLVLIWTFHKLHRLRSLPSGPWGLPFIGYSLFLDSPLFYSIDNLKNKYGKLFSFTAWGRSIIVLADYELIRNALLNRKEFSGRTTLFVNGSLAKNKGISNYDGKVVEAKKKIILKFLKMDANFSDVIDSEVHHFIDYIKGVIGEKVDARKLLTKPICNIVWRIVFGDRVVYDDHTTFDQVERVAVNNSRNEMISARQLMPAWFRQDNESGVSMNRRSSWVLQCMMNKVLGLGGILARYSSVVEFLRRTMNARESKDGSCCLVFEQYQQQQHKKLSCGERERLVFELFAAGTDTTILSLQWACLVLAVYPEIQLKMRQELSNFEMEFPSWEDRNKLRYCSQVVSELHRFASVTPLALPHRTTMDTELVDPSNPDVKRLIPRDSVLLLDLYSVHFDAEHWKEPHSFRPERFDNLPIMPDNLMPFSIGKRSCPGAQLAQAEIFCILVNIIKCFSISPADPESLSSTDDLGTGSPGLTRAPINHKVIFEELK